ncbi:MAG: hypothetical protein FWC47_03705 [Oscillospiraceae bacterium]|nr:hypothetical protein [Oscillospiraceae bacterium]
MIFIKNRHFDNWGLLEKDGKVGFAPIYDCGSALEALLGDDRMNSILINSTDFKNAKI